MADLIIRYQNGRIVEGLVLYQADGVIRLALADSEDSAEFKQVNGQWISEDCEPVMMWLGTAEPAMPPTYLLEDFICPKELAARILSYLFPFNMDDTVIGPIGNL